MSASLKVTVPVVALVYDKKVLKQTLRVAGNEVAAGTRRLIRSSAGGGKVYYGTGGGRSAAKRGGYHKVRYTASAPGQAPVSLTGTLLRSVKVRPFKSGEGVAIREGVFYAVMLQAGAQGVVRKTAALGDLMSCIRSVAAGGTWMEEDLIGGGRPIRAARSPLTIREMQVMELVEGGMKNKEIGCRLGIRTGTVKVHLKHIFEKTGVRGRYGLAISGLKERGLLSLVS